MLQVCLIKYDGSCDTSGTFYFDVFVDCYFMVRASGRACVCASCMRVCLSVNVCVCVFVFRVYDVCTLEHTHFIKAEVLLAFFIGYIKEGGGYVDFAAA